MIMSKCKHNVYNAVPGENFKCTECGYTGPPHNGTLYMDRSTGYLSRLFYVSATGIYFGEEIKIRK